MNTYLARLQVSKLTTRFTTYILTFHRDAAFVEISRYAVWANYHSASTIRGVACPQIAPTATDAIDSKWETATPASSCHEICQLTMCWYCYAAHLISPADVGHWMRLAAHAICYNASVCCRAGRSALRKQQKKLWVNVRNVKLERKRAKNLLLQIVQHRHSD